MTSPPGPLLTQVPLSTLTTLAVGGPARALAQPRDPDEAAAWLRWARRERLPVAPLGGGSNLLAADAGFDGLLLQSQDHALDVLDDQRGEVLVRVGAGLPWDALVQWATERDLCGLECLSGIPGSCGAAPLQNIGAYGQELADTLRSLTALRVEDAAPRAFDAAACGLAYRHSHFKGPWRGQWFITALTLRLRRGAPEPPRYAELQRALQHDPQPSAARIRQEVLTLRRGKSMVYDPDDPNHRSAGSFFTNPILSLAEADQVQARALELVGLAPPRWDDPQGVKLPAAWLIEQAGFRKGFISDRVGLSSQHSLALINRGGADAASLLALAAQIQATVYQRFGVWLHPEPVLLGFGDSPPLSAAPGPGR